MKPMKKSAGGGLQSAYALGALFAALSIICGIVVYAAPDLARKAVGLLTHSEWQFEFKPFDLGGFVLAALLWGIIGFAVAILHNKICECCE